MLSPSKTDIKDSDVRASTSMTSSSNRRVLPRRGCSTATATATTTATATATATTTATATATATTASMDSSYSIAGSTTGSGSSSVVGSATRASRRSCRLDRSAKRSKTTPADAALKDAMCQMRVAQQHDHQRGGVLEQQQQQQQQDEQKKEHDEERKDDQELLLLQQAKDAFVQTTRTVMDQWMRAFGYSRDRATRALLQEIAASAAADLTTAPVSDQEVRFLVCVCVWRAFCRS
jgi:hypothetical protein